MKKKSLIKSFSRWLRYSPPDSLTSKGWRLFSEEFRKNAPIRYFLSETLRVKFYYPIMWKFEKLSDWIRYRVFDRYHVIDTKLKPGYHEISETLLWGSFNQLKDFVERTQAWQTYNWSEERKPYPIWTKMIPFYRRYKYRTFCRPDLGIKHFEWASTLDDPSLPAIDRNEEQASAAREILKLYKWWTIDRPSRKLIPTVVYDDQGFGPLGCFDTDFDKDAEDYKKHVEIVKQNNELEEKWAEEDTEMLIRLCKIRMHLWA